mgnify:FL=1
MRRWLVPLLLVPGLALAQEDAARDRDVLTAFLEDNLSGAGRVVTITGFAGALSSRATIDRLTIADDAGVWITLDGVVIDWSRSSLLRGAIEVSELSATAITVVRPPQAGADAALPPPEAQGFALPELPVSVRIGDLSADRIVLGEAVLGQPVEGRLQAALSLSGGEGEADLVLERTDAGPAGRFALDAGYSNASRVLRVDLAATEAAGGLATTALGIPGAPAVDLSVRGEGPLDAFAATVRLASGGTDRLAGTVTLQGTEAGAQRFAADLSGDLAPLFLPDYAAFFGPEVALTARGTREASGRLDLDALALRTRALTLDGAFAVAADGTPASFRLEGRLADPGGGPVLLPAAVPTRVDEADILLDFDTARRDEGWRAVATLRGLERDGFRAGAVALRGSGRLRAAGGIGGTLAVQAAGVVPADPALAAALGPDLAGSLTFEAGASGALGLPQIRIRGADYTLEAGGQVTGLGEGFGIAGRATLRADDLARFSALAGRPLSGAAEVSASGAGSLLGGGFALDATVAGTDLTLGQAELDSLLRGASRIDLSATRDGSGTTIRRLDVSARTLSARARGTVATAGSDLAAELEVADLSALGTGYRGALSARAAFAGTRDRGALTLDGTATGLALGQPQADRLLAGTSRLAVRATLDAGRVLVDRATIANPQVTAEASGTVAGGTRTLALDARLADLGLILPGFPGPVTVAGTVTDRGAGYDLALRGTGPGQIAAEARGQVAADLGTADLRLSGSAQAALANPFIQPRSIGGPVRFDLALRGPLDPASLSGRVALSEGRLSDPGLPFSLQGIEATADLAGGQARIAARAGVTSGGTVTASGTVGLAAPYPARLSADLRQVILRDPRLYETRVNGTATVTGPLTGGAVVGGSLLLNETELRIPDTGFGASGLIEGLEHVDEPAPVRETRRRAGLLDDPAAGAGGAVGRAAAPLALDLTIRAPNRVFIRGRGLDAELGGALQLGGTVDAVVPTGGFDLIRGRLDILGTRLVVAQSTLRLEGSFDPLIDVRASTESEGITASVLIAGRASAPEVRFVSVPELPEEEVLARLLFGQGLENLSAFQAAQLAGAVATLAGRGGLGLVGRLRQGFGLDDLDVNTGAEGGTEVTAGRYLSRNLYTEITVDDQGRTTIDLNLDVTDSITLRGSTGNEGGTGLGVFLERDY